MRRSTVLSFPSQLKSTVSSRVLASAVKRDPTAADYKYHDDPYLIPYNSLTKRDYIMSKEGGRRSARFILNKHPELFINNLVIMEVCQHELDCYSRANEWDGRG